MGHIAHLKSSYNKSLKVLLYQHLVQEFFLIKPLKTDFILNYQLIDVYLQVCYYMHLPLKKHLALHLNKLENLYKVCFVPSLVEVDHVSFNTDHTSPHYIIIQQDSLKIMKCHPNSHNNPCIGTSVLIVQSVLSGVNSAFKLT